MALLLIVLSGITGALFTLGYKIKEQRGHHLDVFMLIFSSSFLACSSLFALIYGHRLLNTHALIIGIPNGLSMYISVIMYSRAVRRVRLSISWTVVQFCILIPFIVSIVFFETRVSAMSVIGTALILVSIIMFGIAKGAKNTSGASLELRTGVALFFASFFSGLALTLPLVYISVADNPSPFTLLFSSSAVMTAASLIRLGLLKKLPPLPTLSEAAVPLFMSFMQVISLSLLITGLKTIQGSAAYPLKSIIGLLCVYTCSYFWFKEPMIPMEIIGIVISLTAIVMVTMSLY